MAGRLSAGKVEVSISVNAWITAERNRMVDVFQNLFDNAAKYMGGQYSPKIEVGITIRNEQPLIYVSDNGEGIPEDRQEEIFDVFVKMHPNSDGAGMGLALVRRIVEINGGRIWVESKGVGSGSTFYLKLDKLEI